MSLKEVRTKLLISHDEGVIFQGQIDCYNCRKTKLQTQGHFSGFKPDLARLMHTANEPPKYSLLKVAFIVIMHFNNAPKY